MSSSILRRRPDPVPRTALLIRCTVEEATSIRNAAAKERRTLSGYVLNAVMNRIRAREEFAKNMKVGGPRAPEPGQ